MQGFVLVTTFTTWQEWFKWNTFAPQAEVFAASDIPRLSAKAAAARAAKKTAGGAKGRCGGGGGGGGGGGASSSSSSAGASSGGGAGSATAMSATAAAAAADGSGGKGGKGHGAAAAAAAGAFGYGGMYKGHRADVDGELARSLERCSRSGNPHKEGVIWPRVAELSLLGGLGCGRWLMALLLEQELFSARLRQVFVQLTRLYLQMPPVNRSMRLYS